MSSPNTSFSLVKWIQMFDIKIRDSLEHRNLKTQEYDRMTDVKQMKNTET
jgi:hypothetical protein